MHNPLKAVAVIVSIFLLCACKGGLDINMEERVYHTDVGEARLNVPEFSCDTATEFSDVVNDIYNKEASALLDSMLAKNDGEKRAELVADSKIARNDGRITSVIFEGEFYSGGAHGEKFRFCTTADFQKEQIVNLDHLFADDSWKRVADNKMQQLAQSGEGEYSELWELPSTKLHNKKNFYLRDGKLVLYFPPYELSYYRRGYVEFEFEKEELAGYLSDYGREIL